ACQKPHSSDLQHETSSTSAAARNSPRGELLPGGDSAPVGQPSDPGRVGRGPYPHSLLPLQEPRPEQDRGTREKGIVQMDQDKGRGVRGFLLAKRLWRLLS